MYNKNESINGADLPSKLVDGRCRAQSTVTLVDQAVGNFCQKSRKYGLGSLKNTPMESTPPTGLGPTSGQLALTLRPTNQPYTYNKNFETLTFLRVSTKY